MRELILRLATRGCAVLVCTHNLDEVERLADRVAVLRTRLLAVDTPQALRARLFGAARAGGAGRSRPIVSRPTCAGSGRCRRAR